MSSICFYINKLFIFCVLVFSTSFVEAKPFKIIIDPGHGGVDTGAVANSIRESQLTMKVSRLLHMILRKDSNFKSFLTRSSNRSLTLQERSQFAKEIQPDLFLSIHANSHPSSRVSGAEFYFLTQLPPDEEALFLASRENAGTTANFKYHGNNYVNAILEDLKRNYSIFESFELAQILRDLWKTRLHLHKKPIRQAPFHVLAEVPSPSLLVELGYLTNKREAQWLKKTRNQKKMAYTIYEGLKKYKESVDKSLTQRHIMSYAK